MRFKKLYSSVPVAIAGTAVILLITFKGCGGIIKIYSATIITLVLISYLFGFYLYNIIAYIKTRKPINFRPFLTTMLVVGSLVMIAKLDSEKYKSKILLEASNGQVYRMIDLRLRENNAIEFEYGSDEEKCTCVGIYQLQGDTLIIMKMNKKPKTHETFDRYLMTDQYLIPIEVNALRQDSLSYLKVKRLEF